MIDATIAIPAINSRSKTESEARAANTWMRAIRRRQPPHRELDAAVGQFRPAFDLGHVGRLREPAEHLAGLLAGLLARQRERLAPERIALPLAQGRRGLLGNVPRSFTYAH